MLRPPAARSRRAVRTPWPSAMPRCRRSTMPARGTAPAAPLHHPLEAPRVVGITAELVPLHDRYPAGRTQEPHQALLAARRPVRPQPPIAEGGRRRRPRDPPRRDARAGGRKRLRQIHPGAHPDPAVPADLWADAVRRHRYRRPAGAAAGAVSAAHADDLSGSLCLAQRAHDGPEPDRRAAGNRRHRHRRLAHPAGRRAPGAESGSMPTTPTASRTNSPAASASASALPGLSR
jgi:hypothetical protein